MNIFVTGGTGFIGSYVVNELINNGHFVTILARNPEKVESFVKNNSIRLIKGTLSDHNIIEKNLLNQDACIHIALGWGNTALSMLDNDTKNSIFIFEACAKQKVKHIIYTSSTAAVGELRKNIDKNSHLRPIDFYGATKASTEAFLMAISQVYGIKYSIIRPGYTFGNPIVLGACMEPDDRFRKIVFNAKKNLDIHLIKNDGTQFIWAGHLAKLYYNIIFSDHNKNIFFGLGPEFITWEYIADRAIEYSGSKSKIIFEDKGWETGVFMYDAKDIADIFGININTKDELFKHIKFLADN